MNEHKYRICLCVPLGKRNGTMLICETDGKIVGWIDVLNQKNEIAGMLSSDGHITFSGVLRTTLSTIPYTADGTLSGSRLNLKLKTEFGAYYLLSGEELKPDDKIL